MLEESSDVSLGAPKEITKLSNNAGRRKFSRCMLRSNEEKKMNVVKRASTLPISRYEDGKMQESPGW